ncbi:MAG: hypothetical protein N3B12_08955 [Armatimonadetes bacterium]|nr:hypothetical protein [Armatimonadota bacterium]
MFDEFELVREYLAGRNARLRRSAWEFLLSVHQRVCVRGYGERLAAAGAMSHLGVRPAEIYPSKIKT